MKNSRSALMALLAAGGLYAWQNRDKIKSMINSQRAEFERNAPATGATRRFDGETYNPNSPRMYDEPTNQQF